MTKETTAQAALVAARKRLEHFAGRVGAKEFILLADVEVRAEQARQQELANLIAMASNPSVCPFPVYDVLARIKELVNI